MMGDVVQQHEHDRGASGTALLSGQQTMAQC